MTRAQHAAERGARDRAAIRRGRDGLRASMESAVARMVDTLNENMRGGHPPSATTRSAPRLSYVHDGLNFRALFTGDAGEASEARLITSGADLRADVLKTGHHGSRFASTSAFVARVHPTLALISVGRHNTFGHPALATLVTLRAAGARVYRTDGCGAVIVATGTGSDVRTMLACGT